MPVNVFPEIVDYRVDYRADFDDYRQDREDSQDSQIVRSESSTGYTSSRSLPSSTTPFSLLGTTYSNMDNPLDPTSTFDTSSYSSSAADPTTTFISIATEIATAIITSTILGNSSTDVNSPVFDVGEGMDDVGSTSGSEGNAAVSSTNPHLYHDLVPLL